MLQIEFECISIEQIDLEIGKIVTDIDEVDSFIRALNERKVKLVEKFENLKNEKVLRKSLHLANQNWESGKTSFCLFVIVFLNFFYYFFFTCRLISVDT